MSEEQWQAMIAYIQSALIAKGYAVTSEEIDIILEAESDFCQENGIVTLIMDDSPDDET